MRPNLAAKLWEKYNPTITQQPHTLAALAAAHAELLAPSCYYFGQNVLKVQAAGSK